MFGNHGLCGLLEEGAHEKSPKCLGGNLGDFGEFCKGLFMVFDAATGEMLFKLKSPYYLISKFLGRSNAGNIARKLDKRHVDEEYYPLIDHIREHQATFNAMSEHEKIAFIQAFLREL